jgi:Fe2+ transport system protein B
VAAAVRYGFIEREDLGLLCQSATPPWWCGARLLVIQAFLHDVFGLASVALAAFAAWRRSAAAAILAAAIGTVGMVLYGFTLSGVGVLGGALVLARLQGQWQQDR